MIITCYLVLLNPPEKECRLGVAVCYECILGAVLSTGKQRFSQSTMVCGSLYSLGLSTQRHQGDLRSHETDWVWHWVFLYKLEQASKCFSQGAPHSRLCSRSDGMLIPCLSVFQTCKKRRHWGEDAFHLTLLISCKRYRDYLESPNPLPTVVSSSLKKITSRAEIMSELTTYRKSRTCPLWCPWFLGLHSSSFLFLQGVLETGGSLGKSWRTMT